MEYIDGKNIADHMAQEIVPWEYKEEINGIFSQLIDAFSYMEEHGIVHRDIREGNILVDKSGCVKIIDFGLGKIFHKIGNESTDSLVDVINRAGLDLLPEEYFSGKYDSLTDMFYLAELFRRLLRKNLLYKEFSYNAILEKMVKEKRCDRYKSFADVKLAMSKRDFSSIEFAEEDKEIYQSFVNAINALILTFSETPRFCTEPSDLIKSLDDIIENNLLENYIQKNDDLVRCIVYTKLAHHPTINIEVARVKNFRDWFVELEADTQQRVLNNIAHKLSKIKIDTPFDDIPF